VYGFLGDVNVFHGRAHEGTVHLPGLALDSPEHAHAQDAKALAYVRPHDFDLRPYVAGSSYGESELVVRLDRAVVFGPIARLELTTVESDGSAAPIEAQLPAERFRAAGMAEGDLLLAVPRRARVFVAEAT
jgi:sulfate/thiosulfate transport system ATP-binding protein